MTADAQGAADAWALHAALHQLGPCSRVELAVALAWDLVRPERTQAYLAQSLSGSALRLVATDDDLAIVLVQGSQSPQSAERIATLAHSRVALNAAEAGRLMELIHDMLTEPHSPDAARSYGTSDAALAARGIVTLEPAPDASGAAVASVHPDVVFGLGLSAAPTRQALPARPTIPTTAIAEETSAGDGPPGQL